MLVLSHSPLPVTGGSSTSGLGSEAWSASEVSGTTGRLNMTVMAERTSASAASGAGSTWVTSRKPTVSALKETGCGSARPAEFLAVFWIVTVYWAERSSGALGLNWTVAGSGQVKAPGTAGCTENAASTEGWFIGPSK